MVLRLARRAFAGDVYEQIIVPAVSDACIELRDAETAGRRATLRAGWRNCRSLAATLAAGAGDALWAGLRRGAFRAYASRPARFLAMGATVVALVAALVVSTPRGRRSILATSPDGWSCAVSAGKGFGRYLRVHPDRFSGGFLVADEDLGRVVRVSSSEPCSPLTVFGRKGWLSGELASPLGAAGDPEGNVFVADRALGRLTKYPADGEYAAVASHPRAAQVLVTKAGSVLVWPGKGDSLLQRYTTSLVDQGGVIPELSRGWRRRSSRSALFALDDADNLYYLGQEELVVRVFDRDFELTREWAVDMPEIREDAAFILAGIEEKPPATAEARVNPSLQMTISGSGERLCLVRVDSRLRQTVVYVYTLDGRLVRRLGDLPGIGRITSVVIDGEGGFVGAGEHLLRFWRVPGVDA